MSIIVQKFGGTSVANTALIKLAALKVKKEIDQGNKVVVVVSAMSGTTDELVGWVNETSHQNSSMHQAEYDAIVSSGEQITSGLMALALQELGLNARSWQGWQLPISTDFAHSKARIEAINIKPIHDGFSNNEVAVIAGFQGVNPHNRPTTLGRGGSDTSAVAIAAALRADRCDIYTDVDGVYTTDPRIEEKARKLSKISYEEMLEMASLGAKVLQTRSVEMAMKHHVPVRVLSSFSGQPGTLVVDEDEDMEKRLITGIAYSRDDARITLRKVPDKPGVSALLFSPLSEADINVDMIVQNISEAGERVDMTFTVNKHELSKVVKILEEHQTSINYETLTVNADVAKVSVVGVGMRTHSGVAALMFKVLAEKGINIMLISTSEIKISVLIAAEYMELAIRSLHTAFELDK